MCLCGHIKDLLVLFSLCVHICDVWLVFSAGEDAQASCRLSLCGAYLEGEEVAVSAIDLKTVTVVPRDVNDKNLIIRETRNSSLHFPHNFNTCNTV